ncbi:MAG: 30S ribosome-binding factor RbfA [Spirochaetota bacterium]|nr:30S ribosome-binding factor RbfA [Spirochaetota bacterium]
MPGYRKERLEELIKRVVADTLLKDIKDPRIGFVTVTRVKLSRDYTNAEIWVSVIGDEKDRKNSLYGLRSASGYIQYHIGKSIRLKNTPRLKFHIDTSIEEGVDMIDHLDKLEKEDTLYE